MAQVQKSHMLSSRQDEAPIIQRVLDKIQEKLQALVIKMGSQNLQSKEYSEIFTTDQHNNLSQKAKQVTATIKQKCTRILYQVEVLQILLAEKTHYPLLTDSKAIDFGVKKSFESASSKKHLESYIESSFAAKEKDKNEALKEIILTLCNQSQLQLKSRVFLKGQIEEHFSRAHLQDHISVEESKNQTQLYLEKFISQIGELRQKIEELQEQNEALLREKTQLEQKVILGKSQANFQNPQVIQDKNFGHLNKNYMQTECESCFKLSQDNKYIAFKARKMEQIMMRKQNTITEMNEEFSRQVFKYNKVFESLSNQNESLRRYIDQDLAGFIDSLQSQIFHLKNTNRYKKVDFQEKTKLSDYIQLQNQYSFVKPTGYNTQVSRNPSNEFLNQNVFSNCSINDYLPDKKSRITLRMAARSKSKHSKKSLESRPHSYKSHSQNMINKKYLGHRAPKPQYDILRRKGFLRE